MKSAYFCQFLTPYLYVKKDWLHTNMFRPESKVRLLKLILAILKNICKQPKFGHIKFIYSEKATKFEKMSLNVKNKRKISSNVCGVLKKHQPYKIRV